MHKITGLLLALALLAGCTIEAPSAAPAVPTVVVKVDSISCEGCCETIKSELAALPGVTRVDADPESKLVSIQVANAGFDSKVVLDRLSEIKYDKCTLVKDAKN